MRESEHIAAAQVTSAWLLERAYQAPSEIAIAMNKTLREPPKRTLLELGVHLDLMGTSPAKAYGDSGVLATLHLRGEIGFAFPIEEWRDAIQRNPKAELYIDSPGGDSAIAMELYRLLLGKVQVAHIMGVCSSGAVFPMLAAPHRRIVHTGHIMLHTAQAFCAGPSTHLRAKADEADRINAQFIEVMSRHCDRELVLGWMDGRDHWFTAEEALAAGIVHEIFEQ